MREYSIDIANEQDHLAIDEERLREVVRRTLDLEGVASAEISLAIVDDATIHELNRRHLDHDYATDVLSFLLERADRRANGQETAAGAESRGPGAAAGGGFSPTSISYLEGEIVASAEMAARRAAEFGWSPGDELVLYVVHGLLHLTGHDDGAEEEQTRMRSREREILRTWGLAPRYDEADGRPPQDEAGSTGGVT